MKRKTGQKRKRRNTRGMTAQPSRDAVTSTSYDDANEMLNFTPASSSAKNITYDSNGSLSTVTNSCGITTYTWDVRNRLVGISGFNAQCAVLSASFKYDAIGRRIQKTINGTTTQYVYDGLDIIQEKQGGSVTANYIRTLNIDEPLTRIKGSVVRHYVKDALGSIIALTDDTGVVKTTYTYDPFGNVTVSGEASDNPFQYTGRENDGTGLYYYRARYYSPELQRFISEDPIRLWGRNINYLSYVGNNPIKYIDPFGFSSLTYDSGSGTLTLSDSSGNQVGQFPAGNNTTSDSNGPWPPSTYPYSHHVPHPESGPTGPFGSHGNFVFDVSGRTGMGVHSGRQGPESPTRGCVRTTDEGTQAISDLNADDPLTSITVQ